MIHQAQPDGEIPGNGNPSGRLITAGLPHGRKVQISGTGRKNRLKISQPALAGQIGRKRWVEIDQIRSGPRKHSRKQLALDGPPWQVGPDDGMTGLLATPGHQEIGEVIVEFRSQLQGPQLQGIAIGSRPPASCQGHRQRSQQKLAS